MTQAAGVRFSDRDIGGASTRAAGGVDVDLAPTDECDPDVDLVAAGGKGRATEGERLVDVDRFTDGVLAGVDLSPVEYVER